MTGLRELGMQALRRLIRRRFPKVRQLSTAELAAQLADSSSGGLAPILFDVREAHEHAVSHLPGARNLNPKATVNELTAVVPRDRPAVLYCSVGYRSSQVATRLIDAGFTNVCNLDGSIFQWANEGRPLEQAGRPTLAVHPYSAAWRWLVRREARSPLRRPA